MAWLGEELPEKEQDGCHRRNIKKYERVFRENFCAGDMKLRGFQGTHVRGVRLIQQRGEFAEHGVHPPRWPNSVRPLPRYCKLHEGQRGLCFVRARQGDQMVSLVAFATPNSNSNPQPQDRHGARLTVSDFINAIVVGNTEIGARLFAAPWRVASPDHRFRMNRNRDGSLVENW